MRICNEVALRDGDNDDAGYGLGTVQIYTTSIQHSKEIAVVVVLPMLPLLIMVKKTMTGR